MSRPAETGSAGTTPSLREMAVVFLKLGTFGYGGPAAHVAMMEQEVAVNRRWLSRERLLDLIGATNLIPGPNSTELAMHCGHEKAGWPGLVVAGGCFMLPAVASTTILAAAYESYGHVPAAESFLYGVKPAILSIILSVTLALARKGVKTVELAVAGVATLAACLLGANEIVALFAAGFYGMTSRAVKDRYRPSAFVPFIFPGDGHMVDALIFWSFLKIGSIPFGSGYVLFAYLEAELVTPGLLSRQVLMDAVAVGQITPGPVLSAATFVGWQMGGVWGAVLATAGIFLPSFLFVALLNPLVTVLRRSTMMSAFLDFINVGSVAVLLSVCIDFGRESLFDWRTMAIAVLGFAVSLLFRRLNAAYVVVGGGGLGWLLRLV